MYSCPFCHGTSAQYVCERCYRCSNCCEDEKHVRLLHYLSKEGAVIWRFARAAAAKETRAQA